MRRSQRQDVAHLVTVLGVSEEVPVSGGWDERIAEVTGRQRIIWRQLTDEPWAVVARIAHLLGSRTR